jgi:hypothetical protein
MSPLPRRERDRVRVFLDTLNYNYVIPAVKIHLILSFSCPGEGTMLVVFSKFIVFNV